MKRCIKHGLDRAGLLPTIDLTRRLPDITSGIRGGCTGPAPLPVKRMAVASDLKRCGLLRFVETGTHLGDTVAFIARDRRVRATTIELDDAYFQAARRRFAGYPNVTVLHGDSGHLLPALVGQLDAPALFWLDGHYSGGATGKAEIDTPIRAELEAILDSPARGHVVLIDDARCFDGTHDHPHLDQLLEMVRRRGGYRPEVSADIIRLTPLALDAAC